MQSLTLERYNDLIGLVYQAGVDPDLWPRFMQEFDAMLDGVHLAIHGHDLRSGSTSGLEIGHFSTRYSEDNVSSYDAYYASINPFLPAMLQGPVMDIRHADGWVARDDLTRSEFYNDWLGPQEGIGSGGGGVLFNEDSRLLIIGGQVRYRDEDHKTPLLVNTLRLLAPHIRRAFEMQRTLQGQQVQLAKYQQSLDRVRNSVFLLNAHGGVIFANTAARTLLKSHQSIHRSKYGLLGFQDQEATKALRQGLGRICGQGQKHQPVFFLVPLEDGLAVGATLDPFDAGPEDSSMFLTIADPDAPVAILTLGDNGSDSPVAAHLLKAMYRLTSAEQGLAMAVSQGRSLADIAQASQLSIHTLRSQLKAVYAKTGTRRQPQLVALVHQLSA